MTSVFSTACAILFYDAAEAVDPVPPSAAASEETALAEALLSADTEFADAVFADADASPDTVLDVLLAGSFKVIGSSSLMVSVFNTLESTLIVDFFTQLSTVLS